MSVAGANMGAGDHANELRFAQLYERYVRSIHHFCARRVPRDAVDDAVADTFLTVWRCLSDVPSGDAALVWMYGVAHRVVAHQWRSHARRGRLHERLRIVESPPADGPDATVVDDVDSRRILAALARLSQTDGDVLRLVTWEELPVASAAAVLGIQPDTARQRLHRARRNLAREYDRIQPRPSSTPAAHSGGAR